MLLFKKNPCNYHLAKLWFELLFNIQTLKVGGFFLSSGKKPPGEHFVKYSVHVMKDLNDTWGPHQPF